MLGPSLERQNRAHRRGEQQHNEAKRREKKTRTQRHTHITQQRPALATTRTNEKKSDGILHEDRQPRHERPTTCCPGVSARAYDRADVILEILRRTKHAAVAQLSATLHRTRRAQSSCAPKARHHSRRTSTVSTRCTSDRQASAWSDIRSCESMGSRTRQRAASTRKHSHPTLPGIRHRPRGRRPWRRTDTGTATG